RTRDVVEKVPGQTSRTRFWGYKMVNRIDPIACRAAKRACFFGRSMGEDFFNNVTRACRIETRLDARPQGYFEIRKVSRRVSTRHARVRAVHREGNLNNQCTLKA